MVMRIFLTSLTALLAAVIAIPQPLIAQWWGNDLDVPYVPTPQHVVDQMLGMAEVGESDVVYDLGSGDGRIVVTAAEQYGARAVGIDIDETRIAEGRANAEAAGVQDRVHFIQQDLFDADIGEATVVTLYLLGSVNDRLRPKLLEELEPGTRVVSHAFDMGEWEPKESAVVNGSTIHLWVIPAQAAGRWEGAIQGPDGQQPISLVLDQTFQQLDGMAVINGAHMMLDGAEVDGDRVELEVVDGIGEKQRLEGTINGDTIQGEVYAQADGRVIGEWQARRISLAPDQLQTIDDGRETSFGLP